MSKRIPAHVREQQINQLEGVRFVHWLNGYRGARSKVTVRCTVDGHEWSTSVDSLLNQGTGCPECAGQRRLTADERKQQIDGLYGIHFVRWLDGNHINVQSKAVVRCTVDGCEWSASVNNLINHRQGCPECAGHRRWPADERERQINELDGVHFVRWHDGEYTTSRSKVVCRCDKGHEWSTSVNNLINHGSGCPECAVKTVADKRRIPADERVEQINALPNITFVRWLDEYRNSTSKAVCRCDVDGFEWPASVSHLLGGKGCPECAVKTVADKRRIPADERVDQINKLTGITFVRWGGEYRDHKSKAVCRCDKDHEWSATVNSLLSAGTGCPECAEYGYNPSKPGTLYALRSDCGTMVKIGISNNYEQRLSTLKRMTPFNWQCVELLHSDDGAYIARLEKEIHNITEPAITDGQFDGYTEWRKWDARILKWFNR